MDNNITMVNKGLTAYRKTSIAGTKEPMFGFGNSNSALFFSLLYKD